MLLIQLFQPELFLSIMILFQLIFNTRITRDRKNNFPIINRESMIQNYISIFFTLLLVINCDTYGFISNNLLYCDLSTQNIKFLFLSVVTIIWIFINQSLSTQKINYIEYNIIYLLSILSGLLLISASDLLIIYILIEMQALCFYILASFKKNSAFSTEAGIKYFIFGSLISCLFLLALGILYGVTGTLNLYELNLLFLFNFPTDFDLMISISIYLITTLFFFKLAAAPFHFWAPDIYEGSPLASTIIFSILTKLILIFLFIKWISILGFLYSIIQNLLLFVGVFSIIVGTFLSLKQKRLKKLIIYSSISQVGFLILSLSLNNYEGFCFCIFFLILYIFTSILIWGLISFLYNSEFKYNSFTQKPTNLLFISDLKNLFEYNGSLAFIIIIIFFSIAGIPPLVGFLAKIFILIELIYFKLNIIAILVISLSSISIFYYIRIIKTIFFETTLDRWFQIKTSQIVFSDINTNISFIILIITQTLLFIFFFISDYLIQVCNLLLLNSLFF